MALSANELAALSRLLDKALELPESERAAWLRALPPAYDTLRGHLQGVLPGASGNHAPPSLPLTLPPLNSEASPAGRAGERVGPWRLQREVGRGGMGSVWLAERADGAYQRVVALKLPRVAWSEGLLARMSRERRIAARLEHPSIARLYDAGLDDQGRPYIAMEFVDGLPIDAWVQRQKLGVRDTLTLFVQVVRAVAYAHGRLVVHRDLKPSNVLVRMDGRIQLLDFGIARLLEDDDADAGRLTQEHGRALTPHYAAPEQIAGEVAGVQADVYSLGVMLYELLTGTLPYRLPRATLAALAHAMNDGDPPPASTRVADRRRAAGLRGEVDAILARALEREPAARYGSADALAEDLERHLRGDSIAARPDGAWRTLRKWARRHRRSVATGGLVGAALLGGGALALVQAQRASDARVREQQVRSLVGDLLGLAGQGLSQEQLLQRQAHLLRQRLPDDAQTQAEVFGQLAGTFLQLGMSRLAAEHAREQIARLAPDTAGPATQVRARLTLARALLDEGGEIEAEQVARDALARGQGDPALDTEARVLLLRLLHRYGRREEAARVGEGIPRPPVLAGADGALAEAWLLYTDATQRRQAADFAGAEPLYRQAIARAAAAGAAGGPDHAQMQLDLAYELIVRNRRDEALQLMEPALRSLAARGPAGAVLAAGQRAALVTNMALMGQIPATEALQGLEEVQATLARQGVAAEGLAQARLDFHRARLLSTRGHVREAYTLLEQAVPRLLTTTRWPNARYSLVNAHGRAALLAGEHERAHTLVRQALLLRSEMGQARIPFAAVSHAYVVMSDLMVGRWTEAERTLDQAPTFDAERSDPTAGAVYATLLPWHRVRLQLERGDVAGAAALAAALGRGEEDPDTDFLSPTAIHAELACASGRAAEGLRELETMIARRRAEVDEAVDPTLARLQAQAGLCELALGRPAAARARLRAASAALAAQPGVSPWFAAPLRQLQQRLRG